MFKRQTSDDTQNPTARRIVEFTRTLRTYRAGFTSSDVVYERG